MPNGCVDSAFERQMNPALNMFTLHFNAVDISGHRFGPTTGIFFVFLASQVGISSSKLASKFSSPKLFFYYYFFMYFGNLLSRNPSHTASRWNHEENQIFSTWRTQFIFFLFFVKFDTWKIWNLSINVSIRRAM